MLYQNDKQLERSPVVANCCMNRERDLSGTNGYDVEIGFQPLKFLGEKVAINGKARWLDLCCGTGKALTQGAMIIERDCLPIEIVGVDLVGMFAGHSSSQLTLIEASLSTWSPAAPLKKCSGMRQAFRKRYRLSKFETRSSKALTASATTRFYQASPAGAFDLITCIHGLHYIGDKLGLIARACSWLTEDGLFVANLDTDNLRLNPDRTPSRVFAKELRRAGVEHLSRKRLIRCEGHRNFSMPFIYTGADDEAGPNYTKQPVVNSFYEQR